MTEVKKIFSLNGRKDNKVLKGTPCTISRILPKHRLISTKQYGITSQKKKYTLNSPQIAKQVVTAFPPTFQVYWHYLTCRWFFTTSKLSITHTL
jgi:hypothetical protein